MENGAITNLSKAITNLSNWAKENEKSIVLISNATGKDIKQTLCDLFNATKDKIELTDRNDVYGYMIELLDAELDIELDKIADEIAKD